MTYNFFCIVYEELTMKRNYFFSLVVFAALIIWMISDIHPVTKIVLVVSGLFCLYMLMTQQNKAE